MKYIRTKEWLFEVEDEILALNGEDEPIELWFKVVGKAELINSIRVINQADTIEELCDEFVVKYSEFRHEYSIYEKLDDIVLWQKKCVSGYYTIYGAVWTNKGLIYVAKMNDKGELELI